MRFGTTVHHSFTLNKIKHKFMTPEHHSAGIASAITTSATYITSGTLMAGDYMNYLDDHAGAFGVILGLITFLSNLLIQVLNRRTLIKRQLDSLKKPDSE